MKNKILLLFLVLLPLISLLDFFHPGLPITHDGQDHVARVANFYQNLQDGVFIPRWAPNLNWGYGHPILMFLYPFPSYIASFFHLLGFTFVDSTKLVFIISFILSGFTMYLWCKEFLSKEAAFAGALLYMFAPYRFIDLYVRGAIGEHVAFIFPPLILYFLLKISKSTNYIWKLEAVNWKFLLYGSLSLASLILSHNAISLMFLPIVLLYALFLLFYIKHKTPFMLNTFFLIFLGFSLSAFFWIPALLEGKYTLREIVTQGSVSQHFSSWQNFFYGNWNYSGSGQFTVQVGIVQWIIVLIAIIIIIRVYLRKHRHSDITLFPIMTLYLAALLTFFLTLFFMTEQSKVLWDNIPLIQKFQFPWRFLSLTVFTTSLLGSLVIFRLPQKYQTVAIGILAICLLLQNKDYWHAKSYQHKPETFYTGIYHSTTDTGESTPIWSVRFMEHTPKAHIEIISGKAKITEVKRTSTNHQYIISSNQKIQLRENTLYFPGWIITIDGKPVNIQYQDPNNRGLMTFWMDKGEHNVDVRFRATKLRLFANIISFLSLITLITFALKNILKKIKAR